MLGLAIGYLLGGMYSQYSPSVPRLCGILALSALTTLPTILLGDIFLDFMFGAIFDPREHEAVSQRSGSGKPAGEVLEEHRKGWRIRDRVLRPAVVIVAAD